MQTTFLLLIEKIEKHTILFNLMIIIPSTNQNRNNHNEMSFIQTLFLLEIQNKIT